MGKRAKEDVSRLPAWAQRRIRKLEADIIWFKGHCAEMVGTSEGNAKQGPPILMNPYSPDEDTIRLPRGSVVRFMLAEGTDALHTPGIDCQVTERINGYALQVRSAGGDEIVIRPEASNTVLLKAKYLHGKGGF